MVGALSLKEIIKYRKQNKLFVSIIRFIYILWHSFIFILMYHYLIQFFKQFCSEVSLILF